MFFFHLFWFYFLRLLCYFVFVRDNLCFCRLGVAVVWLWCYPWVWLCSIDPCIAVLCHGWHRGVALCRCGETSLPWFLPFCLFFSLSQFPFFCSLNSSIHRTYISFFTSLLFPIIQYISTNNWHVTLAHSKIVLTVVKCTWVMWLWAPQVSFSCVLWWHRVWKDAWKATLFGFCTRTVLFTPHWGLLYLNMKIWLFCFYFSPLERWYHRGRGEQWRYVFSSSSNMCNCSCFSSKADEASPGCFCRVWQVSGGESQGCRLCLTSPWSSPCSPCPRPRGLPREGRADRGHPLRLVDCCQRIAALRRPKVIVLNDFSLTSSPVPFHRWLSGAESDFRLHVAFWLLCRSNMQRINIITFNGCIHLCGI